MLIKKYTSMLVTRYSSLQWFLLKKSKSTIIIASANMGVIILRFVYQLIIQKLHSASNRIPGEIMGSFPQIGVASK